VTRAANFPRWAQSRRSWLQVKPFTPLTLVPVRRYSTGASLIELVKQLRKDTKAGVADCKDALVACNNDMEAAKTWLVDKAKITAAKKSGRPAQDGGVIALTSGGRALIIELNSETDFAAKEPEFLKAFRLISQSLISSSPSQGSSIAALSETPLKGQVAGFDVTSVGDAVRQLTFLYKENVLLRRVTFFPRVESDPQKTHFYSYVHSVKDGEQPEVGKMGCIVQLSTSEVPNQNQLEKLNRLGANLCVQIAGAKARLISGDKTSQPLDTADNSDACNEPDYEPRLLDQDFIVDDGRVRSVIAKLEKELNMRVEVQDFGRFELNAGQEKDQANLGADIQSMLSKE